MMSQISTPPARSNPNRSMAARTWWAIVLAAGLMLAALLAGRARGRHLPVLKSQHSEPAVRQPAPGTQVVATEEGKTFHVPTCRYIHGKERRTITAEEAIREGYAPCVRCEHDLLTARRSGTNPVRAPM